MHDKSGFPQYVVLMMAVDAINLNFLPLEIEWVFCILHAIDCDNELHFCC